MKNFGTYNSALKNAKAESTLHRGHIHRAHFKFSSEGSPKWNGHGIFISHYLDAQSSMFPVGEQFISDSVVYFRPQIKNEVLLDEIKLLAGQEALHRAWHHTYNNSLRGRGYDISRLEARLARVFGWLTRVLNPMQRLTVTVAMEHLTAVIAKFTLEESGTLDDARREVANLWRWHAYEELEHRSAAIHVYEAMGGGYLGRLFGMMVLLPLFTIGNFMFLLHFLKRDGVLFQPRIWLEGLYHMVINPAFLPRTTFPFLAYFLPGFDPEKTPCEEELKQWESTIEAFAPSKK